MTTQYWVIGGDFHDASFIEMVDGTQRVAGPFASREDAVAAWRECSMQSRHRALTRFTIASSAIAVTR